jgi:hypothetical protein
MVLKKKQKIILNVAAALGVFYYAVIVMIFTVSLLNYYVFNMHPEVSLDVNALFIFSTYFAINTAIVTYNFVDIVKTLRANR